MTHYSGLPPDPGLKRPWSGKQTNPDGVRCETRSSAGNKFVYSEINFIVMGALVEKLSGMPLNEMCRNMFAPLGMDHTRFLPTSILGNKIAPSRYDENHHMLLGVVNNPHQDGWVAPPSTQACSVLPAMCRSCSKPLDLLAGRPSEYREPAHGGEDDDS